MCPLRVILIFLSAILAGFLVFRNLRSQPHSTELDENDKDTHTSDSANPSLNATAKVRAALECGFWTFVDLASGRYLWRQLFPSSSKRST
ncbi:uncharacterized protein LOC133310421 [Gastrolobium bilobum]|uniref:uncharacterized protein LOC133310421 n=1 Tax=Gastrolobium bilobum TaxID=150636 RepID=UPI002AB2DD3C|nr:uncharacterized protein LOC133310421 [Gastrolobium bilobum]